MNQSDVNNRPIYLSLKEYARGITGGLLFSFPLLFTMEVWWAGFSVTPFQLMILMVVTFLLLLGYNRYAGMHPGVAWKSVMIDSVEEMGVGLTLSAGILLMLNRIQVGNMSIDEIMGKVIIEGMAVSIGVSIGTAQLGDDKENEPETKKEKKVEEERSSKMGMAVLALCGSLIVGGNVAPTEEVLLLAVEAKPVHVLTMAVVSVFISVIIVYFSDFRGSNSDSTKSKIYNITFDTCVCYLLALGVSFFCLWFFGRFQGTSFWNCFAQCITLGVLSSLGASAGRLLIK